MMTLAQPPEVEMLPPITKQESKRLKECEEVIERGLQTFYEVGTALAEIRDARLYRITYTTFEDYCQERWGMSRRRGYELIAAAAVVDNVRNSAQAVPANEAQANELSQLDAIAQDAVWKIAVGTADKNGDERPIVTAAHIKSVVSVLTEVVKAGGLDDGSGEVKPLGQLIDAAITEETYERMMRQKEYIRQHATEEKETTKNKRDSDTSPAIQENDAPLLSKEARAFLDDYMVGLAGWALKIPEGLSAGERDVLEMMIYEQGADAKRLKGRSLKSDCETIIKVLKDTEAASHSGDMAAADLYEWLLNLRYFISEREYRERLEYMSQESVRMALLTDAGEEGRQEGRRGALPGIVCIPWKKVWNQSAKRERDEDDDG
jgi:hypothetical protein